MINLLLYTEKLEESGFTKEQANTTLKVLVDIMNQEFATKHDLERECLLIRQEIKDLRSEMKFDITTMSNKLTIRLGSMMIACFTIFFGLLQLTK
jgi:hypothetical protein